MVVAGFIPRSLEIDRESLETHGPIPEDMTICRCERVKKSDIIEQIRAGIRDMNLIKAATRAGMGTCGGRTCTELIKPFSSETKLGDFAGENSED